MALLAYLLLNFKIKDMHKSFLKTLIAICFFLSPFLGHGQSQVSGVVKGLKLGDTAVVKIQKNAEAFYFKKLEA